MYAIVRETIQIWRAVFARANMTRSRQCFTPFVNWLALLSAASLTNSSSAANLVARWQLLEAGPPYADTSGNFIPLYWYSTTAAPGTGTSFEGTAAQLIFVSPPAIST